MRRWWALLFVLLAVAAVAGWWFRGPATQWALKTAEAIKAKAQGPKKPDPKGYAVLLAELARWRDDLAGRHKKARTGAERDAVEHDARVLLELTLPAMMRCWLGTPWDFNGTAEQPGAGSIACGYFVATVLKDAGFQVDRYQLARQSSENIMRSFLDKEACTLTVGKPYDAFASDLQSAQHGIYIIGLDSHVAFLVVDDAGFRFIHSSGSKPWCVVDETRETAGALQRSNWRMLGNLTADPKVIRTWLKGDAIRVKGT